MKKLTFLLLTFFISLNLSAQVPPGYYDAATGTGATLKTQLFNIIKNPSVVSYDGLWTAYLKTDRDKYYEKDNTVLDIYSENPIGADPYNYTFITNQCGNYSGEGGCYNREHSFPKSWFNDASPMYSDLFHIYPTDGKVNGERSNYPYGTVSNPTWTSQNGSKLGPCSASGYSGTVFEPIDEFKGDLARTYFYMVTCYEDKITAWTTCPVLDGTTFPAYQTWFLNIMLDWNAQDPVSQKEVDRNDSIYKIQGNRNPYIDHPEYVNLIWGGTGNIINPSNFSATGTSTTAIQVNWSLNASNDSVLLAYNTTNTFGTPSGTYSEGNLITGGGTVLYVGKNNTYNHTSLNQQKYYYKIWSYDGVSNYSSGVTTNASPILPEPSNYPTNFTSSQQTSSSIVLTWTDATGSILPAGYVIKANLYGQNITAPADGTPETEGIYTKIASYGDQTVTFDGLNASTKYTFNIFPYTNSGTNINFKTDGIAPKVDTVTTVLSAQCEDETFTNIPAAASNYADRTWTGDDGLVWTATTARTDQTINSSKAICFKGYALSPTISNGIGDLTVTTKFPFSDGTSTLTVYVNGNSVGTVPISNSTVQTTIISGINISGDVQIKVASNGTLRAAIDDLKWTCYSLPSKYDQTSNVLAPASQITAAQILKSNTNFINVFSFKVADLGTSDSKSTFLKSFNIYPKSGNNTALWSNTISEAKLYDGVTEIPATINIADNLIHVDLTSDYEIADNSSQDLTLAIKLNNASVVDFTALSFMIDADNNGFLADTSGSGFLTVVNSGNDILSEVFLIVPTSHDITSQVLAPESQIAGDTIHISNAGYTNVFSFKVSDLGTADGLPTTLDYFEIYPSIDLNTAVWTSTIEDVKLFNNSNEISISKNIAGNNILITPTSPIVIADNSNEELTIAVKLNNSTVVKNTFLCFMIDADNHGFIADTAGSVFAPFINSGNNIVSNKFSLIDPNYIFDVNNKFKIYPNPVYGGVLDLDLNTQKSVLINIYDANGKILKTVHNNSQKTTIDISDLLQGLYFISVTSDEFTQTQKFLIKK